jgi:hypothetical protein
MVCLVPVKIFSVNFLLFSSFSLNSLFNNHFLFFLVFLGPILFNFLITSSSFKIQNL